MLGAQSAQPTQIMTGLALVVSMYHHQALDRVDLFHGVIAKTADDCFTLDTYAWWFVLSSAMCDSVRGPSRYEYATDQKGS